jgi:hypothetical protein
MSNKRFSKVANKTNEGGRPAASGKKAGYAWIAACAALAVAIWAYSAFRGSGGDAASDLVIPISEITSEASFYAVEVGSTQMEVIAVEAPDGTIRTAFNTCQVCYSSGRGYYVQDGDSLVCQNCLNRFSMSDVEVESGGCNPVPIMPGDKTVTEDSIIVSGEFLSSARDIFANWKAKY